MGVALDRNAASQWAHHPATVPENLVTCVLGTQTLTQAQPGCLLFRRGSKTVPKNIGLKVACDSNTLTSKKAEPSQEEEEG